MESCLSKLLLRQFDNKPRAAWTVILHIDLSAVIPRNGTHNRKPRPHAVVFRGKIRLGQTGSVLVRNAGACPRTAAAGQRDYHFFENST
ncbi:MAG: hypothetical protein BWK80_33445 [Desulfobacteraceae bacterium IS3]|nr:MAG: hypothetical protein BWK80_33445 [Desulfobacteraceae bacterium IS3]